MFANYEELKTEVATYMHRSNLSDRIPGFIHLAEVWLNRELKLLAMQDIASLSLLAGADQVAFPAKFKSHIDLRYADTQEQPQQKSITDLSKLIATTSGRPSYFATSSTYKFNQKADKNYSLTLTYYKGFDIAKDDTNWLIENAPDAYLYRTLIEARSYVKDDGQVPKWAQMLKESISSLSRLDGRTTSGVKSSVDTALVGRDRFNVLTGS